MANGVDFYFCWTALATLKHSRMLAAGKPRDGCSFSVLSQTLEVEKEMIFWLFGSRWDHVGAYGPTLAGYMQVYPFIVVFGSLVATRAGEFR